MRRLRIVSAAAASLFLLLVPACDGETPREAVAGSETPSEAITGGETPPVAITAKDFDPSDFDDSTNIDNAWFPMQPGTQLVWEGHAFDGDERIRRRVVFTVTDLTKVIAGVRGVVIQELDYDGNKLAEKEIAFFAQDDDGNVWQLGQYPEEYEGGEIVKAPVWIHGLEGARAGISMKADPQPGTPSYAQGWAPPPVNWTDRAKAYMVTQKTCVPFGCFEDVLVTREFNRDEPGASQLKFYAPGVGNVRVGWMGPNEEEREVLVLVDVVHLSPEALAQLRTEVLEQDRRGYDISNVYARTPPAEQVPVTG